MNNQGNRQNDLLPSYLSQLQTPKLTQYLKVFLDMGTYRKAQQAKPLKKLISSDPEMSQVKVIIKKICQLIKIGPPTSRVCSLQFLKSLMEIHNYNVAKNIQKYLLPHLIETIQYRSSVKSISRGSIFFIKQISKGMNDQQFNDLTRLSNTYFRMSHEVMYIWGKLYLPESQFGKFYKKLAKYCTFPEYPTDFKFYTKATIENSTKQMKEINEIFKNKKQDNIKSERSQITILEDEDQEKSSLKSKKFQKASKIKPKKPQIPRNIVYRQNEYEDIENKVEQIQKLKQTQKEQFPLKNKQIELPLKQIKEQSGQQGSSFQKTSKRQSKKIKSKNSSKNTSKNQKNSEREGFHLSQSVTPQISAQRSIQVIRQQNEQDLETIILHSQKQSKSKGSFIGVQEITQSNFFKEVKEHKPAEKKPDHKKSNSFPKSNNQLVKEQKNKRIYSNMDEIPIEDTEGIEEIPVLEKSKLYSMQELLSKQKQNFDKQGKQQNASNKMDVPEQVKEKQKIRNPSQNNIKKQKKPSSSKIKKQQIKAFKEEKYHKRDQAKHQNIKSSKQQQISIQKPRQKFEESESFQSSEIQASQKAEVQEIKVKQQVNNDQRKSKYRDKQTKNLQKNINIINERISYIQQKQVEAQKSARKNKLSLSKTCDISYKGDESQGQSIRLKRNFKRLKNFQQVNLSYFPQKNLQKQKKESEELTRTIQTFSKELSKELENTKNTIIITNQNKMNQFKNKLVQQIQLKSLKSSEMKDNRIKKKFFSQITTPKTSGICNGNSARIRRSLSKQKKEDYEKGTLLYSMRKRASIY